MRSLGEQLLDSGLSLKMKQKMVDLIAHISRPVLADAFKPRNIRRGFELSGGYPFKPEVILGNVRGLVNIDKPLSDQIKAIIPAAMDLAK